MFPKPKREKRKPKPLKRSWLRPRPRKNQVHVVVRHAQIIAILESCHPQSCIRVDRIHVDRAEAVSSIRHQVFARSGGRCEHVKQDGVLCGRPITWANFDLNERHHRGRGGLMSIDNSEAACRQCHRGGDAHPEKTLRWSKK